MNSGCVLWFSAQHGLGSCGCFIQGADAGVAAGVEDQLVRAVERVVELGFNVCAYSVKTRDTEDEVLK